MKGGMQSERCRQFYCPVCDKPVSSITDGIIKHITRKGTVLYCSVDKNLKRVRKIYEG